MKKYLFLAAWVIMFAGCTQDAARVPEVTTAVASPMQVAAGEEPAAPAANPQPSEPQTEAAATLPEPAATAAIAVETTGPEPTMAAEAATETAVLAIQPIEVTYFTPAQQEGPYYTVEKPADRDNDLVDFAGAGGEPLGQQLYLSGIVYDANGLPVEGITVEIWQTDAAGVYLHPNDANTASRDPNFQFYGEATTGADGVYSFRTILPGLYEPRPRHIHVKVKLDGQELLTTQFYFAGEIDLQGDDAALLITTAPAEDDAGDPILIGERDIILSMPISN
jgi:protocatechuate 3,4-dioxygenase beta subunit